MRTLASFALGRRVLSRCGVQPAQYGVLVDLFGALGERKEVLGSLGTDQHAMRLTSLYLLLPGVFLALLSLGPMSLASFNLTTLAISSALLMMLLVLEAANSFLNPAEVSVLAHRPIAGATYFAAKLSYLVLIVFRAELALNGPAALAGLLKPEARWFYPLSHLGAALLLGLFLSLVASAIFGILMRVVPLARLKGVALWVQLLVAMLPLGFNLLRRPVVALMHLIAPQATSIDWSFVPLIWFNALALAGHGGPSRPVTWGLAAIGGVVSSGFIGFGIRSLSAGYLTRIVRVVRAAQGSGSTRRRASPLAAIVARLAGGPAGRAAYEFMTRMMRRDWQFRRAMTQSGVMVVVFLPILLRGARQGSPFDGGPPRSASLLPEILAFALIMVSSVLSYTDHFKGAWVFNTAGGRTARSYARGVYWTLVVLFIGVPIALLSPYFGWIWGVGDTLLFGVYTGAVATALFSVGLFLLEGLPFTEPPKASRTTAMLPMVLFGPVAMGIAWVVQGMVLFHSRWATVGATAVAIVVAVGVGRLSTRALEMRMTVGLRAQVLGPSMFQTSDES